MWCVWQFVGEILACPVLVVFAVAPQPAHGNIIYNALVGNPYFIAVLPVAQSQLGAGVGGEVGIFGRHN